MLGSVYVSLLTAILVLAVVTYLTITKLIDIVAKIEKVIEKQEAKKRVDKDFPVGEFPCGEFPFGEIDYGDLEDEQQADS